MIRYVLSLPAYNLGLGFWVFYWDETDKIPWHGEAYEPGNIAAMHHITAKEYEIC